MKRSSDIWSPVGSLLKKNPQKTSVEICERLQDKKSRQVLFSLAGKRAWLLNIPNVFQALHVSYSTARLGQVSVYCIVK
jgi:hypothetical protein